MEEEEEFDIIILGTGVEESIIAAALSKVGLKILHVDRNSYYGSSYATRNLTELGADAKYKDICVDLNPKFLFANDELVNIISRSNVSSLEFNMVHSCFLSVSSDWVKVPFSKEDIFVSEDFDLLEKRRLMKFISESTKNESNHSFLPSYSQLSNKSKLILRHAICHHQWESSSLSDIDISHIKHFASSSGRYGPSPFLIPLYGVGELSQTFCRIAAVNGSTYILNNDYKLVFKEKGNVVIEIDSIGTCKAKCLVTNLENYQSGSEIESITAVGHFIVWTSKCFLEAETILVIFPPKSLNNNNEQTISLIQHHESINFGSKGWLLHFWGVNVPRETMEFALTKLQLEDSCINYKYYYVDEKKHWSQPSLPVPSFVNLLKKTQADEKINIDHSVIEECKQIFEKLCADFDLKDCVFFPQCLLNVEEEFELNAIINNEHVN